MSDPVCALNNAVFDGLVRLEETGPRGMVTLRGDLGAAAVLKSVQKAVKDATGLPVPAVRRIVLQKEYGAGWMSPDELLLMMPYDEAGRAVKAADKALKAVHSLVVNVSDARSVFRLSGAAAPEVLAKLAPVDFTAMAPDEIRRSRLAQVPAAFWRVGDDTYDVVAFRSVSSYVFELLKTAAAPGSGVGFY